MKKTILIKVGSYLLLIFFSLFIVSCGQGEKRGSSKIIGKWQLIKVEPSQYTKGIGENAEFFEDGTYTIPRYPTTRLKWNVLKDGRIKIQLRSQIIFPVIKGDTLILEYHNYMDGKLIKETFKRIK